METVLITGANRGIGFALCKEFLQHGYSVYATYRGDTPSNELLALAEAPQCQLIALDVTSSESVKQLAIDLADVEIDILINNAGVIGPMTPIQQGVDSDEWLQMLAANVVAPVSISAALLPNLKRAKRPRVITISSEMGTFTNTDAGMLAYRTSKAGASKAMQVLAAELKEEGIIVCPMHPGWVQTDMGGPQAPLTATQSAAGLYTVISQLTLEQTGLLHCYDGSVLAW